MDFVSESGPLGLGGGACSSAPWLSERDKLIPEDKNVIKSAAVAELSDVNGWDRHRTSHRCVGPRQVCRKGRVISLQHGDVPIIRKH